MLTCIKQHLSNIWSSIHEKVKQHWDWVEKEALLIKKQGVASWDILAHDVINLLYYPIVIRNGKIVWIE